MEKFSGYPITKWKDDDCQMVLLDDLSFTDHDQKVWNVPLGAEINGASIPSSLWNIVGSPFVGKYRRASVVHDYFAGEGHNPNVSYQERREADKMFYEACRTDGCSWKCAALLYLGVSIGSWWSRKGISTTHETECFSSFQTDQDALIKNKYDELLEKVSYIIEHEENFEKLVKLVDQEID
ncbi:DUF1353 domain-containing protein [Flammeovirga yaeyamensis]|uniref:DUF1353 domain-containing protein n=1 Tax=Flammeovirga yaeyamensis TaxID=367791 RepID=A0AAX1NBM7_9BACT|nr:DUF1353 domain-containing protein [Flammeovirga yaeyamensis]MBB3697092.1 hypothetical protein [Flammeovirga yaeyamensis]NMF33754.1 DUF1353 domain-containing protein [Flammeovirga yaeyamensis]QWG04980.1 DUF1353 domain-containing protein [Flammeovirga yaeyamensis]